MSDVNELLSALVNASGLSEYSVKTKETYAGDYEAFANSTKVYRPKDS